MASIIEETKDYFSIVKNPDMHSAPDQMRFIPYKDVIIELGMEKEEDGKRVKFKALHYPKDKYPREKIEQKAEELINCPNCNVGKVFTSDAAIERFVNRWTVPNDDGSLADTTILANLPQEGDNWFVRNLHRNNPLGEPNIMVLGTLLAVGTIALSVIGVPLANAFVGAMKSP